MRERHTVYALGEEGLLGIAQTLGGGGEPPNMEVRLARIEACIAHIQSDVAKLQGDLTGLRDDAQRDFRIIFAAMIGGALALAGLMAKGFGWL